jgi:HlyD family secretion protein
MKKLLPLVVLLMLGGAGYYFYTRPPVALVLTGIVTTKDVVISPQISGQIDQLLVAEGDVVKADQLLAVITPDELRAERAYASQSADALGSQVKESEAALRFQQMQTAEQIRQAESNLSAAESQVTAAAADVESAQLTYTRTKDLADQHVASQHDLDQARTTYDSARARLNSLKQQAEAARAAVALARANAEQVAIRRSQVTTTQRQEAAADAQRAKADLRLAYTQLKAPINAVVDTLAVRAGEVVNPGQPVVTLINPDDLWIRADVEETYISRVRLGDHLTVRLPSGEEREGTVFYRGADASFATQRDVSRTKRDIKTFEVRLRVDNRDRRLAVGMTAYVLLRVQ